MPGHITHTIFANAAASHTKQPTALTDYNGLFCLGAQGPDIFFYYFPGFLMPRVAGFGSRMHKSGYGRYVAHMAGLAWAATDTEQHMLFAYTAGLATHYFLDVATHPYVFARTEIFGKPIKNSAAHRNFETNLDTLLHIQMKQYLPTSTGRYWHYLLCPSAQRRIAAAAAAIAASEVYGKCASASAFHKAMAHMIWLTRALQSKKGRRKQLVRFFERPLGLRGMFSNMIHTPIADSDMTDYLNSAKAAWAAPWATADVRYDSFMEMFFQGRGLAAKAIDCIYDVVYGGVCAEGLQEVLPEKALAKPGIV